MLARLIATVAALLIACASPQASAYVRAESANVYPGHSASEHKTAPPARAKAEHPAPGENAALTHCHVWQNWSQAEKSASATALWHWDSAPFGDTAANENPTAGIPNFTFNLRFPGQQYDRETGTHYNYFRDYEAGTGRFVQSDPIGLRGGINSFEGVDSDPLSTYDEFGLKGKRRQTKPFQVGEHDELKKGSKNTGLDIHHVGQKHIMKQKCGSCYDGGTGPAIAIPRKMHHRTVKFRGTYCGNVRSLVNFQLKELRRLGVPEKAIKKLGKLIYKKNPEAFK